MSSAPSRLDPFETDHPAGYLADSQFDYPGRNGGWQYYALNAQSDFARFEPLDSARETATPLAYLGCDDVNARVGRDVVAAGYQRRPCLQWHAPAAGTYRIDGEVALLRSNACGNFRVRIIVDDVEILTQTLGYPQVLSCEIDAAVRQGGFVRVLFESVGHIDNNDALFYLRVRHADSGCGPGESRISSRCEAPAAWSCLQQALGQDVTAVAGELATLAQDLYKRAAADGALLRVVQAEARRHFEPHAERYRQPRYFSIHPVSTPAEQT